MACHFLLLMIERLCSCSEFQAPFAFAEYVLLRQFTTISVSAPPSG